MPAKILVLVATLFAAHTVVAQDATTTATGKTLPASALAEATSIIKQFMTEDGHSSVQPQLSTFIQWEISDVASVLASNPSALPTVVSSLSVIATNTALQESIFNKITSEHPGLATSLASAASAISASSAGAAPTAAGVAAANGVAAAAALAAAAFL